MTGHQWLLGGLLATLGDRWRCFPVWSRLVSGKQHPAQCVVSPKNEVSPMSIWETTLALITQAVAMLTGAPVCVVMVRVVIAEGVTRPVLVACTDLNMSAGQILELYAARFSLELAIRDLKGAVGMGDYQSTTPLAFCRFVLLSCVACCLGRLLVHGKHVDAWLDEMSVAPVQETGWSFARLRRGITRFCAQAPAFLEVPIIGGM